MAATPPPAGWFVDPSDPSVYRYWDGSQWTDQTAPVQPPVPAAAAELDPRRDPVFAGSAASSSEAERVRQEVRDLVGQLPGVGGGTVWTEVVLVIVRRGEGALRPRAVGRYDVLDQIGRPLAAFAPPAAARGLLDQLVRASGVAPGTLELRDVSSALQLTLKHDKNPLKGRVSVNGADGSEVGIVQSHALELKAHMELIAGGVQVATVRGPPWGSGPGPGFGDFWIADAQGSKIATIRPPRVGLRQLLTNDQHYVLVLHVRLDAPLLPLVIGCIPSIDRARQAHAGSAGGASPGSL